MRLFYVAHIRVPSEKAHTFQIFRMCAAFAAAGAEVTLVVPDRRNFLPENPFLFYGVPHSFQIIRLPVVDTIGSRWLPGHLALGIALLSFLSSTRRFLRKESDAVIYTRELWLLPFLHNCGCFLAFECHDFPARFLAYARWALRQPDVVFATTDALATRLSSMVKCARVPVYRNGVDATFLAAPERNNARQRLGLPQDRSLVVYTGQLHAWKGIETLLRASALLPTTVRCVVVGGTDDAIAAWQKKIPDARVQFVGQRPRQEMPLWLAAADVCVLPNSAMTRESQEFTSPIKLFEYLAAGCTVVASDLPSIREIVGQHPAVTFVPPDDAAALAVSLQAALSRPQWTSQDAADTQRQAFFENYSWDARAKKILDDVVRAFEGR